MLTLRLVHLQDNAQNLPPPAPPHAVGFRTRTPTELNTPRTVQSSAGLRRNQQHNGCSRGLTIAPLMTTAALSSGIEGLSCKVQHATRLSHPPPPPLPDRDRSSVCAHAPESGVAAARQPPFAWHAHDPDRRHPRAPRRHRTPSGRQLVCSGPPLACGGGAVP